MTLKGQSLKRFEDHRLLIGAGSFVGDIKLPDLLHAVMIRSPHAHALIRSVAVAEALSLPGVVAVVTGDDISGISGELPSSLLWADPAILALNAKPHPILAKDRACYVGQAVAMVVAESLEGARDAADLVKIEYETLEPIMDPLEALKDDAVPIHQELGTNLGMRIFREGGDVDAAFAKADRVVKQHFEVPRLTAAPMETRAVAAYYQSQENLLTVWSSTQGPHQVWHNLAQQLGRPEASVRVIAPDVGGGFGAKYAIYPEEVLVPYLALTLGWPIRWVEDRQENMLSVHARGHLVDMEAAVKEDGTILAFKILIVADLGAYFLSTTSVVPLTASQRIAGPYKTPAMRVEVLSAITNKPSTAPYRGAGGPESAFCMERTIELIARELGLDPVALRRRNFVPVDGFPHDTPTGLTYDSGDYEKGLDRVLELADYQAWRDKARERRPEGPLIGVGLATVVKASGGGGDLLTEHARVDVDATGQVTVYTGVSPHGQGTETSFAQLASRELGVDPSEVQVLHSDTALFPLGYGTGASRGTVAGGSAVYVVLEQARDKLAQIASHLLQCPAEEVVFEQGRVRSRQSPGRSLEFSEVARAAHNEELLPPGVSVGLEFNGSFTLPHPSYGFGAHVAVVEVDTDTGEIKIIHYAAVHDCGRIINPMLLEGQVHGAIAQGVGQALTEGMVYSADGQPITGSLMDYGLPLAGEFPNLILDTVETPSPLNPLGAKGIGELPTVAAPVAITNAVMDALASAGVRHLDTPLTPEKIWRALQTENPSRTS